jgi:hypothetical protein
LEWETDPTGVQTVQTVLNWRIMEQRHEQIHESVRDFIAQPRWEESLPFLAQLAEYETQAQTQREDENENDDEVEFAQEDLADIEHVDDEGN